MKIHVDRKYEALTEGRARRLVQAIFKYAKSTFRMKNGMDVLVECGYAKRIKKKIVLVGYGNLCNYISKLSKAELQQFFLFFVNMTHQAAYLLSKKDINEFKKDINESIQTMRIQDLGWGKGIPIEDLIKEAKAQGVNNVEEVIEELKRQGDIYEPKKGIIKPT